MLQQIETTLWDEIERFGYPKPGISSADEYMNQHTKRWEFIQKYSFAFPSPEAVKIIVKFADGEKILEIGAGSGLWARLLSIDGAMITATDDFSWSDEKRRDRAAITVPGRFYSVEKLIAGRATRKYIDHNVLFLCWPPYNTNMAYNALKSFQGNKVVYIGEGYDGCTGNDKFHNLLEKEWEEVSHHKIPQWDAIHDRMYLYKRN